MTQTTIRHGLFLTYGKAEDGRRLAICSDGTPQLGHEPVTVLTIKVVKSVEQAKRWFNHVRQTRPWETRQ